ncbi:unnamed protein product [Dibothriocephalus latus]|uniref:Uncharacterized protein n=1 Tax=Dibothriocephalus latus TaxID=60516 RepID=A0A3P7N4P6_DIBLA|nr:unnamed protein product [Dibothriocephalus latus]
MNDTAAPYYEPHLSVLHFLELPIGEQLANMKIEDGDVKEKSKEPVAETHEEAPAEQAKTELPIGEQLAKMKIEDGDAKDSEKPKEPVAEPHEEAPAEQAKTGPEKEVAVEEKKEVESSEPKPAETMEAEEKEKEAEDQPAN